MKKARASHWYKRVSSMLVASAVLVTTLMQGVAVQAASESTPLSYDNLLKDPGFEDAGFTASREDGWYTNGAEKQSQVLHGGSSSAVITNSGNAIEQDILDIPKGIIYEFSIWAKADSCDPETQSLHFGIKGYGGEEKYIIVDSTEWKQYTIEFPCTSGEVRCYAWLEKNTEGNNFYVDDASLTIKNDLKQVAVENGSIRGIFKEGYAGSPAVNDFTATYSSSLNPKEVYPVTLSATGMTESVFNMTFDPIAAQPLEQTITMYIKYAKGTTEEQSFTLDYKIAASGEDEVLAAIQSLNASNGALTAILDKTPTVAPVAEDFAVSYKIGEGAYQEVPVTGIVYTQSERKAEIFYKRVPVSTEAQTVTLKVTYQGKETLAAFQTDPTSGRTFYVAANGDDSNDGLSEETPVKSMEKLNTITFQPGDHILFHKGDVFQGALKPQGSGVNGAPIVMASYGDANAPKPVLKSQEQPWKDYVMSADAISRKNVNNCISFENQEYWEVRDLELTNWTSNGEPTDVDREQPNYGVYERGINIRGKDAGDLDHMYFDNLTIHGFHGTRDNLAKSSGGILMEVQAEINAPASESISTSINDIRVTNCEMYDLGRSGINFVTVWARRTETKDSKWGPYYTANHGAPWKNYGRNAYKNFYLANNYFHEIDGDACIVDTCDDAVVEHNLVYSCKENAWMAVGLFNWNSDNTTFQYNEVYGTHGGTDGQGIEIDALNDKTYVQYNYIHDNEGGSLMYCNNDQLYGFDGVYRYNIFQNDGRENGLMDLRNGSVNAQCYNNTFYMKDLGSKGVEKFIPNTWGNSKIKMYNNIFYYAGEEPFQADGFLENTLDWKTNVFYNFANVPEGNGCSNITEDPMLADPGKGGTGKTQPVDFGTLSGYALQEGSPAIDAGTPVEDNGGQDFFGNPAKGLPDIGAFDSGSIGVKIASIPYGIDHKKKTVSIMDGSEMTAATLLENLTAEEGAVLAIYHGAQLLSGRDEVAEGDTVRVRNGAAEAVYTVKLAYEADLLVLTSKDYLIDENLKTIGVADENITVETLLSGLSCSEKAGIKVYHGAALITGTDEISLGDKVEVSARGFIQNYYINLALGAASDVRDIPVEGITAKAGSEENAQASDIAANVLDGNKGTLWHSKWGGDARENLWIQLDMAEASMVDGVRCLPRDNTTSGVITKYKIQYSKDGTNFQDVPGGTGVWEPYGWQIAQFLPIEAKSIRLYALESPSGNEKEFVSIAEMRLTGSEKPSGAVGKPAAPTGVGVDEETVTTDRAMVRWNPVNDSTVVGYVVAVSENRTREAASTYYIPDNRTNFYILNGLSEGTNYSVQVSSLSVSGEQSPVAAAEFTTKTTGDTESPTVPSNLNADKICETKAALSWDASSDDIGVTGYEAAVKETGAEGQGTVIQAAGTNVVLSKLAGGKEYTVTVKAVDASGNQSAVNSITFTTADKTSLRILEAEAARLEKKLTSYPEGTEKDSFVNALLNVRSVIANEDAQASDIQNADAALSAAMEALTGIPAVRKEALAKLVETAKGCDLNRYVDDGQKEAFAAALADAENVLASSVTQGRVDQAYLVLQTAMENLTPRADKNTLQEWVTWGKNLDLTKYTKDTAAVFQKALGAAETLLGQDLDESHQSVINAAIKDLETAYKNLKKADGDTAGTASGNKPKTGDGTNVAVFLLLAAAAAEVMWKLRRKYRF